MLQPQKKKGRVGLLRNKGGAEEEIMQSSDERFGLSTPIDSPQEHQNRTEERIQLTGTSTSVGPHDVLCGRGKESFNHLGNKRFRETISNSLEGYSRAVTRMDKSLVVLSIFEGIRNKGGRFLKKHEVTGEWEELSEQQTKEKIAHAVRDAASSTESRRKEKKTSSETDVGVTRLDGDLSLYPSVNPSFASTHLDPGHQEKWTNPQQIGNSSSEIPSARAPFQYVPLPTQTYPLTDTAHQGTAFQPARDPGDTMGSFSNVSRPIDILRHSEGQLSVSNFFSLGQPDASETATSYNQGLSQLHQSVNMVIQSSAQRVTIGEPNHIATQSSEDTFLDLINDVLGPLSADDQNADTTTILPGSVARKSRDQGSR